MADANVTISPSGNTVRPLTTEELAALTNDLQNVLIQHGAEMGVTSTINLVKVVETPQNTENEPENTTEEGPESGEEATPDSVSPTEEGS